MKHWESLSMRKVSVDMRNARRITSVVRLLQIRISESQTLILSSILTYKFTKASLLKVYISLYKYFRLDRNYDLHVLSIQHICLRIFYNSGFCGQFFFSKSYPRCY